MTAILTLGLCLCCYSLGWWYGRREAHMEARQTPTPRTKGNEK